MSKILATKGTGYAGLYLVAGLHHSDYEVITDDLSNKREQVVGGSWKCKQVMCARDGSVQW